MNNLVAKVQQLGLFLPGETVVAAVSGGADSVALLDILTRLEPLRLKLVVAHLNHGLRGEESDDDERFVAALARRYGLPFESRRLDVAAYAERERLSLEDAGRRARYEFFEETARLYGAASIALAHHRDDQAETVLMRLLRGAGGDGLSAMSASCGTLKRPLLSVSRSQIEGYLKGRGLTWRTDASNADTAILRNSIRHELIPFLKRYNPRVSERLAATAEILAGDEELLESLTLEASARVALAGSGGGGFSVQSLLEEPRPLRLRLYRLALRQFRGDLTRVATSHLEAIDRLAASPRPNARLKMPGDCFVTRCYDALRFESAVPPVSPSWELLVTGEGSHVLPGGGELSVRRIPRPERLDPGAPTVAYICAEAAPFPWVVRSAKPGDRFVPLGMTGAQKIKDLFINGKVPPRLRGLIPLLVCGGEILWVAGIRMGERGRVTSATEAVLRVEIPEITP